MIQLQEPALSLNSVDVPGPHYNLTRRVELPAATTPLQLVSYIVSTHLGWLGDGRGGASNIVINCHGHPWGLGLSIGGLDHPAMKAADLGVFGALKPLNIGPIWLVACEAAQGSDGVAFCQRMASVAGTAVIASNEDQDVGVWDGYRYYLGYGSQIDDYEGTVFLFYANGSYVKGADPHDVWTVIGS